MISRITKNMLPAFQGAIPPTLVTVNGSGMPNITYISHLHYIDEKTVALSRQFFNKTWKNLKENPFCSIAVTCPESFTLWKINLQVLKEVTSGSVFAEMDMLITAIATMQGMEDVFQLQSAVICSVQKIETLVLHGKIS